jgi:hypothetical protein
MKKIIILVILYFTLPLNAQKQIPRFVKLTLSEKESLKKEFNWNGEDLLIVNFINSPQTGKSKENSDFTDYWNEFYKDIDLEKNYKIFVYSNCNSSKKNDNAESIYNDKNETIQKIFFGREQSCEGIVLLNEPGNFIIKHGKYSKREVANYITELKNE